MVRWTICTEAPVRLPPLSTSLIVNVLSSAPGSGAAAVELRYPPAPMVTVGATCCVFTVLVATFDVSDAVSVTCQWMVRAVKATAAGRIVVAVAVGDGVEQGLVLRRRRGAGQGQRHPSA